jgi:hypothetical protein
MSLLQLLTKRNATGRIHLYSNPTQWTIRKKNDLLTQEKKYINRKISIIIDIWSINRLIYRILKYVNIIQTNLGKYERIITEWIRYLKHHLHESDHIEFGLRVISPSHITDSRYYSGILSSHSTKECITDRMATTFSVGDDILTAYFIYAVGCDSLHRLLDYLQKTCYIVIERSSLEHIKKQLLLEFDTYNIMS